MGFFDKVLKAMGFEEDKDLDTIEKEEHKKKDKRAELSAKFDLRAQSEEMVLQFEPSTQKEVGDIVKKYADNKEMIIDLSNFVDADRLRALDFISGAAFVLGGKIEKVEDSIYKLRKYEK